MKEYLEIAETAARLAGKYLLARVDVTIDENLERDVKLANDKESERVIIEVLEKTALNILTEERGMIWGTKNSSLRWIVDPLDETGRRQALVEILGNVLFLLPVCLFLGWASWDYVSNSWATLEGSSESGGLAFVYLQKSIILLLVFSLVLGHFH